MVFIWGSGSLNSQPNFEPIGFDSAIQSTGFIDVVVLLRFPSLLSCFSAEPHFLKQLRLVASTYLNFDFYFFLIETYQ